MDPQKGVDYSSTYNQVLTTLLPTQQVQHIAFFRLDEPRVVVYKGEQLRLVSGLATATKQTLRLYAVYEQTVAFELGSWRLHEDIRQVVGWDRLIVINTGQRIVGLRLEGNTLRNTFMLSLEFLPLDDLDSAQLYPDRVGNFLLIKVRNYLIYCISENLILRFKKRPVAKENYQIVEEEVSWNDHEVPRAYLAEVIKIRLPDFGFGNVDKISVSEDFTYMWCHKGGESVFSALNVINFFYINEGYSNEQPLINPMALRDQPPANTQIKVSHPRPSSTVADLLFVSNTEPFTITLKTPQHMFDVATYETPVNVFNVHASMFPILVWEAQQKRFTLFDRTRTFQDQYEFKSTLIAENLYAEKVIYRDGLVVICSKTGVTLVNRQGQKNTIHTSIGNIIDFHVSKDMIFIQNYEDQKTRIFEMSRSPKIDPRPFVTHKKKMTLQQMPNIHSLFSLLIGSTACQQILAVKREGLFKFYRDNGNDFDSILEPASEFFEFKVKDQRFLLLRSADGLTGKAASFNGSSFYLSPIQWEGWSMQHRRCIDSYLIAYSGTHWCFFNFIKQEKIQFQISLKRQGSKFIDAFFNFRQVSSDRTVKDNQLLELYLCFSDRIEVWLLNLAKREHKLIYEASDVFEGCPFLTNELGLAKPESQRDRYRSITCPEYVMIQHGLRLSPQEKGAIIAAQAYFSQGKNLLLFVTDTQELLLYRIYFSLEESGIIFRRVCTPLNVVKNFSWDDKRPFKDIGQKVVRAGNFLFYKGELLQNIQNGTIRSFFRMEDKLWALQNQNKIRQVKLGSEVRDGFWIKEIQCSLKEGLMGLQSSNTPSFYCTYNRKGFEIFKRQQNNIESHWHCQLGTETIVTLRTFNHLLAMSYYDYFRDEEGNCDPQSVRFRFRVYNCATKNKIVEREKPLDEPILHIRYMPPDRLLLVTSSVIFINLLKEDKTLESFRAHNFTAKRSFLTAFSHIPDIVPQIPGGQGSPTYMLFGGAHGGLGFYVGKWIEEEKLKQVWYEGLRCPIRHVSFFNFGQEREQQLRAIIADDESNLLVLGLKLDRAEKISDIRLGAEINSIKSRSGEGKVVFIALSDGSIKILNTVKLQNADQNFLESQKIFCQELPFVGGFNLRTSRQIQQSKRSARLVSKGNIVDCDLFQQLFSLTKTLKQHIIDQTEMEPSVLKGLIPF